MSVKFLLSLFMVCGLTVIKSLHSYAQEPSTDVSGEFGTSGEATQEVTPLDDSIEIENQAVDAEAGATDGEKKTAKPQKKKLKKPPVSEQPAAEPVMQNVSQGTASGPDVQTAPQVRIPEGAEISQGERIAIEGKGFSLKPPVGWIIERNLPRASLSLVAPVPDGQYPSNINVIRFNGPKLIDKETAEKFADKIVKDFPGVSSTIENYTLRNTQPIQLADGRQAFLFYTDFLGSGRKMMQAHVLASSETNHYLLTYTDVAENFEPAADGSQSQVFNFSWETLASLELDSPNPKPSNELVWILGSIAGVIVLWLVFGVIRNRRAAIEYRSFADRGHQPGDQDELISSLAEVGLGQRVSLEPTLMSFPKDDEPAFSDAPTQPEAKQSEMVRGKKIKVDRRNGEKLGAQNLDKLPAKAAEVSSIEFSQDKFKREG